MGSSPVSASTAAYDLLLHALIKLLMKKLIVGFL
jgi:hypothetical protein